MFAYEAPGDAALVLAAGVSDAWLDGDDVEVTDLPTWWGPLGYTLRRDGARALQLDLAPGLREPPGGIVVRPPLRGPLTSVAVDGQPIADFDAEGVTLAATPGTVVLRF